MGLLFVLSLLLRYHCATIAPLLRHSPLPQAIIYLNSSFVKKSAQAGEGFPPEVLLHFSRCETLAHKFV
jgi:hypothetical protein